MSGLPHRTKGTPRWLRWSKRFGVLIILVAAFYMEENWRGERAWKKFRAEWEAKGERFDVPLHSRPEGASNANHFGSIPLFEDLRERVNKNPRPFEPMSGNDLWTRCELDKFLIAVGTTVANYRFQQHWDQWKRGERIYFAEGKWTCDLDQLPVRTVIYPPGRGDPLGDTEEDAARSVLNRCELLREFAQLEEGLLRPHAWFSEGANYAVHTNPPAEAFMEPLAAVFQMRGVARLRVGDFDGAFEDLMRSQRLDLIRWDLCRLSFFKMMRRPITQLLWEGLISQQWNEEQLIKLHDHFESWEPERDFLNALRQERSVSMRYANDSEFRVTYWRQLSAVAKLNRIRFDRSPLEPWFPSGWHHLRNRSQWELMQRLVLSHDGSSPNFDTVTLAHSQKLNAEFEDILATRTADPWDRNLWERIVDRIGVNFGSGRRKFYTHPGIKATPAVVVSLRGQLDLVKVVIALERYYQANGRYPEKLQAIVPQYLDQVPLDNNDKPYSFDLLNGGRLTVYRSFDHGAAQLGGNSTQRSPAWRPAKPHVPLPVSRDQRGRRDKSTPAADE